MALPFKGPFTKSWGHPTGLVYVERTWRTQAKPYDRALPFNFVECREVDLKMGFPTFGCTAYRISESQLPSGLQKASVDNRCREKLYAKLGEAADLAVSVAEYRQAVNMIAGRASQLLRAYRAVRRGRFGEASRVLGVTSVPKRVSASKQVSNNWLEFHFGWVPLIKDIYSAVEVLQGPVPDRRVKASASSAFSRAQGPYPKHANYGQLAVMDWYNYSVRSGFTFRISNPDLWLANRLGLINPATVAWELVPFSFVVDWFVPVGDFLGSMTATRGLALFDGYTSRRWFHQQHHLQTTLSGGANDHFGWAVEAYRSLGALSATPTLTPSVSFSPTRAFTAVTLLVQQFKKR